MKRFLAGVWQAVERVFTFFMIVGVLAGAVMFGSFFLNLFGILRYDPPVYDAEKIVSIELVKIHNHKAKVAATLPEEQVRPFMEEFLQIRFGRYANDPPEPYGDRMVRITYSDGYVDCIGEEMNQRFDPSGQGVSAKGWYYCPGNEIEILFEKYTDRSDK
ncbi:MAG: hypothetical protein IKU68_08245 [Oscillospiraceae bacterium]|nr:hypothetical protein [Oscillospiraceae bacterium]